jgi:hypothetical protein
MLFALPCFILPLLAAAIVVADGFVLAYHFAPQATLFATDSLKKTHSTR